MMMAAGSGGGARREWCRCRAESETTKQQKLICDSKSENGMACIWCAHMNSDAHLLGTRF